MVGVGADWSTVPGHLRNTVVVISNEEGVYRPVHRGPSNPRIWFFHRLCRGLVKFSHKTVTILVRTFFVCALVSLSNQIQKKVSTKTPENS